MTVRSTGEVRASWARGLGADGSVDPELSDDQRLARSGAIVADDLEHRGYKAAGTVRQLARRVAELSSLAPRPETCPVCGGPLVQPRLGRRRNVCSARCRATKWRRKGGLGS